MMEKHNEKRKDICNTSKSPRSTPTNSSSRASGNRASSSKSVSSSSNSQVQNKLQSSRSNDEETYISDTIGGYDLRAHLQQIMTFSDDDYADFEDESSEDFSIESFDEKNDKDDELHKLAIEEHTEGHIKTPLPTTNGQSLVPINEEDDDLDSEEENEIMKEIRSEITNNIRAEMKSELEIYKAKMTKLEKGTGVMNYSENNSTQDQNASEGNQNAGNKPNLYADLDDLEPKLRDAIIKMRKLDKILSKRVRREKEVKRDRILLERRIRRELEELHKVKTDEYKEVYTNEQKFLALELPARHNEGASNVESASLFGTCFITEMVTYRETPIDYLSYPRQSSFLSAINFHPDHEGVLVPDEFTGEEVFATQLNEQEYPGLCSDRQSGTTNCKNKGEEHEGNESVQGEPHDGTSDIGEGSQKSQNKKKRGKDFIKRNKELAADAKNLIAMTEEEKKRLDELLVDVDSIPDIADEMVVDEDNPFQLAMKPGDGFCPNEEELRSLTTIDSQLKELLPHEDYELIASSSLSNIPKYKLFTHTGVKLDVDWESRGEKVLFQNAEQREMNERIAAIDQELAKFHSPDEIELPYLGEDELHDLIDQCITSLSHTSMSRINLNSESRSSLADSESTISNTVDSTAESTPRSPRSIRQDILDNPPKLAPEVLQKLLSEAYHPLSKQLSMLKEVEDEENECTPIPSEVWKLISEEKDLDPLDASFLNSLEAETNSSTMTSVTSSNDSVSLQALQVNDSLHSVQYPVLNQNSKNSIRTLTQKNLSSSHTSLSDTGEKEQLKLPEIDPTGSLVTQRLNNQKRSGSGSSVRTPVNMVRNNFMSDSKLGNTGEVEFKIDAMSLDADIISPHPPTVEKREANGNKSRTTTPAN